MHKKGFSKNMNSVLLRTVQNKILQRTTDDWTQPKMLAMLEEREKLRRIKERQTKLTLEKLAKETGGGGGTPADPKTGTVNEGATGVGGP